MEQGVKNLERPMNLLIAGGGTGGHLFPGIAIAQTLLEMEPESNILFVNSGKPFETAIVENNGFPQKAVPAAGMKGLSIGRKAAALMKLPLGVLTAIRIFIRFKPDVVLGLGGYSSGPVVLAAWLVRLPTAICEQNRLPGITTRMLARLADRIFVSFPDTLLTAPEQKISHTGNPVRSSLFKPAENGKATKASGMKAPNGFHLLVFGGSQGADGINQAMMEALPLLARLDGLTISHQAGEAHVENVKEAYATAGMEGDIRVFFEDMAREYQKADLVVCRSGATTVAEVTALGIPAIMVPFPHATDDHQTENAKALVDQDAAEMIPEKELTGKLLARRVFFYFEHREVLARMAANAGKLGQPGAGKRIVKGLAALAGICFTEASTTGKGHVS